MREVTKAKTTRIIIHILVWVVILVVPVYSAKRFRMGNSFLLSYYTFMAVNAVIFYINYLFLVPGLFLRKKRYLYYISALTLVFCFYFISDTANRQVNDFISKTAPEQFESPSEQTQVMRPRRLPPIRPGFFIAIPRAHLVGYTTASFFMVFLSLGISVLERQSKIEKMQEEMERARLNAELAFLKNQVSPHFFFNTLNNIYSLSKISPEDSRDAILKLSNMMRYLLYDSEDGDTKLSNEIELMKNYIDLMRLRLEENYKLSVKFQGKYRDFTIPPLLFIPLIENAFKHGVSYSENSFIDISLSTTDNTIVFRTFNSISRFPGRHDTGSSGIGLQNVRKRLDLLFPGRHVLQINKTESTFEVLLRIEIT
ncbi:MAG TPA: histidine kinase [Bacteroidales bacterium]|nr:histidine kinase [Bacteroidales bacterium]